MKPRRSPRAFTVSFVGALLLVRTLLNLDRVDVGFKNQAAPLFKLHLPSDTAVDQGVAQRLLERLRTIAGVHAVGISAHHQINDRTDRRRISIPGDVPPGSVPAQTYVNRVGGEFFQALGISLRAGRLPDFNEAAVGAQRVVVNEIFVQTFLRGRDPIGSVIDGHVIVAVVEDTKYGSVRDPVPPTMFVPFSGAPGRSVSVQLRTVVPTETIVPLIRHAVEEAAPGTAVYGFKTAEQQIDAALERERFLGRITALFGGLALSVAILAVVGSTSLAVSLRTREIAIRIALGARSLVVFRLVTHQTALLALVGLAIGTGSALLLTRFLKALLYGVEPLDVFIFGSAVLLIILCTGAACALPAQRVLRLDPAAVLRGE